LLKTAGDLLRASNGKPRQANLRRAVSTVYYALFHCLARSCADLLVGGNQTTRSQPAWQQVYRALEHGRAKQNCLDKEALKKFPKPIQDFGNIFVTMQVERHQADYSPNKRYYKSEVFSYIFEAYDVINGLKCTSVSDRRAFATFVLLEPKTRKR